MLRRMAGTQAVAVVAAVCGLAAVSLLMAHSSSRSVVLRSDPDAPSRIDMQFETRMQAEQRHQAGHRGDIGARTMSASVRGSKLERENARLRSEVSELEGKINKMTGSTRLARGHKAAALQGLSERMQWAKAELGQLTKGSHSVRKVPTVQLSGTVKAASDEDEWPGSEPWVKTLHNGEQLSAMTTPAGDDNPISKLQPGDYWKDPYDRPFLHAPNPHDPGSTLAHTVTGDYASPATWGEIYHSKQTIDWCTSYFPFFADRIRCIEKLHSQGPLLG